MQPISYKVGAWLPTLHQQVVAIEEAIAEASSKARAIADKPRTNNVQCSLHAQMADTVRLKLLDRLVALCGTIDFDGSETLWEHEIVFIPEMETPFGPARNDDVVLRARADVLGADGTFRKLYDRDWTLCFLGSPEPPNPSAIKKVTQRVVYESSVTGDAFRFMELLGYRFNYEFTKRGYRFTYKNLTVNIFRIYKLQDKNKVTTAIPLSPEDTSWTIEVFSSSIHRERVPEAVDRLYEFASYVAGLVNLIAVDHTVFKNRIYYNR
ncbi:Mediator of RNA polymerase II transcription subunit 18 [Gaertneriomyces sp. JEL0708]|nr:Mediator of RNA polymerase II transcription subunit 18 [Gaertneriomyces sp. JEL0708]